MKRGSSYSLFKSSKGIALALIGSVGVFFAFKSCYDARSSSAYSGYGPTTRTGYGGGHSFYHGYYGGRGGGSSSDTSHTAFHGSSRGGFGSTGHSSGT
jgi:hypothetical protein